MLCFIKDKVVIMVMPKIPTKQENISFEETQKRVRNLRIKTLLEYPDYTAKQKKVMFDFYGYCQRKGLRLESQRAYLQNLKLLFKHLDNALNPNKKDIDKYLSYLDKTYKSKTDTERRMFLIKFYSWFFDKKWENIPFLKNLSIKKINGMKLPEEILSPNEIKACVSVANNFRDKCIIILLYELAARKGEFLQLKVKHIEIKEHQGKKFGFVTVPMGKTESRKLPIIYSLPHVINHLNSHPNRDDPNAPLFVNQGAWLGRALGEDGLKRLLQINGRNAGIKKKIYPHLYRHSRLTELAKELTEQELKKFAGWTPNSNMASVYVHLSGTDVSDKILANAGLIDFKKGNKSSVLLSIECPSCLHLNSSDTKICKCGKILDLKTAQDTMDSMQKEESDKDNKITELQKQMEDMIKEQKEFREMLLGKASVQIKKKM